MAGLGPAWLGRAWRGVRGWVGAAAEDLEVGGAEGLRQRLAAEDGIERFRVQGRLPDGILY